MDGTHTLRPGSSRFCLPVVRDYDDSIAENNETFTLSVSSTSNDVQISPTSITVEIVDDDGRSDACPQCISRVTEECTVFTYSASSRACKQILHCGRRWCCQSMCSGHQ